MTVVDTPGAQNPELSGQSRGATFEELCHNYAQERLQLLFHQRTFARELERYKEVTGTSPRAATASSALCMSVSWPSPPWFLALWLLWTSPAKAALMMLCAAGVIWGSHPDSSFAGSSSSILAALFDKVPGYGWCWW